MGLAGVCCVVLARPGLAPALPWHRVVDGGVVLAGVLVDLHLAVGGPSRVGLEGVAGGEVGKLLVQVRQVAATRVLRTSVQKLNI